MIVTDLSGRVAVVAGSGGALDSAIVKELLDNGAKVALCRKKGLLPEIDLTADENFKFFDLDLSDFSSIPKVFAQIIETFGKVNILINNPMGAFLDTTRAPLHEIELEEFEIMTDTWFKGLMRFSKLCAKDMCSRKYGNIVNVISVRGMTVVSNQSVTVSVSAGLHGMTRMWGIEMRDYNIRANGVAVGVLEDEPELPCGNDIRFSHAGIKRPCSVKEAATAVLFLASDASSYMTGTIMTVDGGISAGLARSF